MAAFGRLEAAREDSLLTLSLYRSVANRTTGSDYYYLDQSRKALRRGWFARMVGVLLVALTVAMALGLVLAYLSTGVSPNRNWWLAFFGLMAPFLFLGNFILLLCWIVRWRWWFAVPCLVLLCGIGHLRALMQFRLKKEYSEQVTEVGRPISVMTYNIHGFRYRQQGYNRNVDSIAAYVRRVRPDVICFQEFQTASRADQRRIDSLLRAWPHREFNDASAGRAGVGTAVFSKFPIVAIRKLRFDNPGNSSSMYVDLLLDGGDTVRVFNNHLQSTQIDANIQQRVEQLDVGGDTRQFVRRVGSNLRSNYKRRAVQVDTISELIARSPHPVVVVGDFNDTPVSYTYRHMRGGLLDPFIEVGGGWAYTYNRLFSMLRIDYVFCSEDFTPVIYRSDNLPWSDHNPVYVRLR